MCVCALTHAEHDGDGIKYALPAARMAVSIPRDVVSASGRQRAGDFLINYRAVWAVDVHSTAKLPLNDCHTARLPLTQVLHFG